MEHLKYFNSSGVSYETPETWTSTGSGAAQLLPELVGALLTDNVLALIAAHLDRVGGRLRITCNEVTCDSVPGRITVLVGLDNRIKEIYKEVCVRNPVGSFSDLLKAIRREDPECRI